MRAIIFILFIILGIGIIGCANVHEQLEQGGQVVGSVAAVPQSVGQGVTQGYVHTDTQSNPYNR